MTKSLRTLYLLWLPIAFLGLVLLSRGHSNAAALKPEHGSNVDTTLNGYNHELIAAALKEGRSILARDEIAQEATVVKAELGSKVDTSLDGYDLGDEDEDKYDTITKRSVILAREDIAKDAAAIKSELATQVDTSLDGYDLSDMDEEDAITKRSILAREDVAEEAAAVKAELGRS